MHSFYVVRKDGKEFSGSSKDIILAEKIAKELSEINSCYYTVSKERMLTTFHKGGKV
jgi:hypothetical protein